MVVQDLAQPHPVTLDRGIARDRQRLRECDEAARQPAAARRQLRQRLAGAHVPQQHLGLVLQDHGLGGDPAQERELRGADLREHGRLVVENRDGDVVHIGMAAPEHR
ncbi:MAG TPA: hypothetical protein VFX51_30200 [Solirubrobacteraceae bacterium]|nr:hypothetical protein [Solirubrobacteraceae bacterium]